MVFEKISTLKNRADSAATKAKQKKQKVEQDARRLEDRALSPVRKGEQLVEAGVSRHRQASQKVGSRVSSADRGLGDYESRVGSRLESGQEAMGSVVAPLDEPSFGGSDLSSPALDLGLDDPGRGGSDSAPQSPLMGGGGNTSPPPLLAEEPDDTLITEQSGWL